MKHIISIILVLVGLMNLYPVIGALSAETLTNLYGVVIIDNDLQIMMRHRAILLGILGVFIVISAFRPNLQVAAIIAGLISMLVFIGLVFGIGDYGELIKKVMLADVIGSLILAIVLILRCMNIKNKYDKG